MTEHTYEAAGVSLDAAQRVKERIKAIVTPTHGREVMGGVGAFGAMYRLSGYKEPVLVSSTDGVGTKLKVAAMLDRCDGIGEDLVNACVNDVIVSGARPLFFLDYLAVGKLDPGLVEVLLAGMARACKEADCALIGGETAQMPGLYAEGDFDLAGFVVGVVEKSAILDSSTVADGDLLVGVPSNGLHTNGYSLVRHALGLDEDPSPLREYHEELGETLGEALLRPHRSYYAALRPVMPLLKFDTIDEVIERANNSDYGLAGAVWTKDTDKGVEIAEQLETGTVWINEFMHLSPFAPFGGHKQSGFGAEYGVDGLKEFTYPQVITVKRDAAV